MTLGRETSYDVQGPWTTASYKGDRSRRGSYEESAGFIVPLEGVGQHNPTQGKGPYFSQGWSMGLRQCRLPSRLGTTWRTLGNCKDAYTTKPSRHLRAQETCPIRPGVEKVWASPCACFVMKTVGPPYSGKLHVRWDGKGMGNRL
jgi:hypothetical protein